MTILAIDPGTTQSGYVVYDDGKLERCGVSPNETLLLELSRISPLAYATVAIEMVASYGMPVGREVFETCVWIGRFLERSPCPVRLVYRRDVKLHLCGTVKAKDANIRQALIDKFGPVGTKKAPGRLYGIRSHAWAALAVAVTAAETVCAA